MDLHTILIERIEEKYHGREHSLMKFNTIPAIEWQIFPNYRFIVLFAGEYIVSNDNQLLNIGIGFSTPFVENKRFRYPFWIRKVTTFPRAKMNQCLPFRSMFLLTFNLYPVNAYNKTQLIKRSSSKTIFFYFTVCIRMHQIYVETINGICMYTNLQSYPNRSFSRSAMVE